MQQSHIETLLSQHFKALATGLLIRQSEERILQLFSQGKINGTVHTCIGQEMIAPCLMPHLHNSDQFFSNHRGHGHYISKTDDVEGLIAEIMGRESGVCKGMGGSQHLYNTSFISNGIQGGMVPIAAGMALSFKIKNKENIAVAFIGDGTLGQGILYEAMNLAGIWKLPLLIVLENNGYAQSTSIKQTLSGNIKSRVEGFGLNYFKTNSNDLNALNTCFEQAVNKVRQAAEPTFVEVETYRLMSHSKGDDNRDTNEVENNSSNDILTQLIKSGHPEITRLQMQAQNRVDKAVIVAEASKDTIVIDSEQPHKTDLAYFPIKNSKEKKRLNEAIYLALKTLCEQNSSTVLLGEDIAHSTPFTPKEYGGAFKVTRDLSTLFPQRVRNTPISEAAITGIGTGLALAGMRPFIEIMFGDFITLTIDQLINHATKFHTMFGKKIPIPLVIRTPMGGRRGYGPTHSQSLEKLLLGVPNLHLVALNQRIAPKTLYNAVAQLENPAVIIENKVLYTRFLGEENPAGFVCEQSNAIFPTVRVRNSDNLPPDLTLLCYGAMLEEAEQAQAQAFEELELIVEVLCPTLLSPLDISAVVDSVMHHGRLLVVEEGSDFAAFGSEIAARLLQSGISLKQFSKLGYNGILPCALNAETQLLPSKNTILKKIKEMHLGF